MKLTLILFDDMVGLIFFIVPGVMLFSSVVSDQNSARDVSSKTLSLGFVPINFQGTFQGTKNSGIVR